MQRGFALDLMRLVRCSVDGGELRCVSGARDRVVIDGDARCSNCGRTHRIADGILSLLGAEDALHPESANEMNTRDARSDALLAGTRNEWRNSVADAIEVEPTLRAIGLKPGMTVAELGCGPGRYTLALAQHAAAVLAVDFSRSGLLVLRQKLDPSAPVGLVHADVTRPYAAHGAFDRILSTLHSNLPGRAQRFAALQQSADALADTGEAVISMHHYCVVDLMLGTPAEGHYPDSGIYRQFMRRRDALKEMRSCFGSVRFAHLSANIPGIRSVFVAKAAARVPLVRSAFARLFLAIGSGPRRRAAVLSTAERRVPTRATSAMSI